MVVFLHPPRPLAGHFFGVEMLRDPSLAIFSALECSATPRRRVFAEVWGIVSP